MSEPKGRGADWTEERRRSDEGRRRLQAPRRLKAEPKGRGADWTKERGTSDERRRRLRSAPEAHGKHSIEVEVASQPACWRQAAGLAPEVAGSLPASGERVAVAGCGTSWFMAQAYAAAREAAGQGETDAFAASEMPTRRPYDRVLVLSRSGTTTEILQLLAQLRGTAPTVAITAGTPNPVSEAADAAINLGFADEESVVQTRFATTELALLRAHLGQDIGPVADAAERVLAQPLPTEMLTARQFTFLGTGWTVGLASEAALKLREAAGLWTEAYPAMEYRHGPAAVTGEGSVVWLLGTPPDGMSAEVAAAGGTSWHTEEDPLAELVRVQMLAAAVARARGLDPDRPRNLARSVILSPR
jgi:fructoselysine-6-P-deglycase FrlB-like protein